MSDSDIPLDEPLPLLPEDAAAIALRHALDGLEAAMASIAPHAVAAPAAGPAPPSVPPAGAPEEAARDVAGGGRIAPPEPDYVRHATMELRLPLSPPAMLPASDFPSVRPMLLPGDPPPLVTTPATPSQPQLPPSQEEAKPTLFSVSTTIAPTLPPPVFLPPAQPTNSPAAVVSPTIMPRSRDEAAPAAAATPSPLLSLPATSIALSVPEPIYPSFSAPVSPAAPPFMQVSAPTTPQPAPPPPAEPPTNPPRAQFAGDVFLDGARVGRWISDYLSREIGGPQGGVTFHDPRIGPAWPGSLHGD